MKLLAQADVVLALGTRLGPFGTLPQHGIDYWPKNAKIIQVDANPRKLGLVKQTAVGICGDAQAAAADILNRLETGNRAIAAHGNKRASAWPRSTKQKADWEAELNRWGQADGSADRPAPRACASSRRRCRRRHGDDRHRQYLLGLQLLSALRASRAPSSRR